MVALAGGVGGWFVYRLLTGGDLCPGPVACAANRSIGRKQFLQHMPETVGDVRPGSTRGGRLAPINEPAESSSASPRRRLPAPPSAGGRARTRSDAAALAPTSADASAAGEPGRARTRPAPPAQPRPPDQARPNRRSTSADRGRVSTAQLADSAFWDQVSTAMAGLDPEGELETLRSACDQLYDLFASLDAQPSARKTAPVLRNLFRLLDMKDTLLLLKLVRVILTVLDKQK